MSERVDFTRSAAERIANVVRLVEGGDRDEQSLRFKRAADEPRKVFRIATFTGAWSIAATKTVTFKFATANTVVATNLFAAVPAPTGSGDCAIAKEGTAWFLIAAVCSTATT
jgi:hypothetical protein